MPTYVLSKVKRTGAGQKVGDLADQELPTTELTALADDDKIPATDTSASGVLSWFAPTRILTYIIGKLVSLTLTVAALQAKRTGESQAWASLEGALGGTNAQPGIALGPGTGGRDTILYREEADHLKTPDKLTVGELAVASNAGRKKSRSGLGLGTASTKTIGTNEGHVPVLGRYGYLPASTLDVGNMAQFDSWTGSQSSYNNLGSYDVDRFYFITS